MNGYMRFDHKDEGHYQQHGPFSLEGLEKEELLDSNFAIGQEKRSTSCRFLLPAIVVSNILLFLATIILWLKITGFEYHDPSQLLYSPANSVIEYIEKPFEAAFYTHGSKYMGYPTNEIDELWEDLYNFGVSVITEDEANKLPIPTLPIPGSDKYLIQLDVFHELHCLNKIRKALYPERYGDPIHDLMDAEGNVNRSNNIFLHWDHCINTIRQSLMCHADVSPLPFHVAEPPPGAEGKIGIFPRLATKHTCRNFDKIRDWARERQAESFKFLLTPEEAQRIKETSGFDQISFEQLDEFSFVPD